LAILTQGLLIAVVVSLCWSRLVFDAWAIKFSVVAIVFIYVGSALCCFFVKTHHPYPRWLPTLGFILACSLGLSAGFMYKQHWLGYLFCAEYVYEPYLKTR
jgi:hypothetical protein